MHFIVLCITFAHEVHIQSWANNLNLFDYKVNGNARYGGTEGNDRTISCPVYVYFTPTVGIAFYRNSFYMKYEKNEQVTDLQKVIEQEYTDVEAVAVDDTAVAIDGATVEVDDEAVAIEAAEVEVEVDDEAVNVDTDTVEVYTAPVEVE